MTKRYRRTMNRSDMRHTGVEDNGDAARRAERREVNNVDNVSEMGPDHEILHLGSLRKRTERRAALPCLRGQWAETRGKYCELDARRRPDTTDAVLRQVSPSLESCASAILQPAPQTFFLDSN